MRVAINRAVCHPPLLLLIPILAFVAAAALVPESSTASTMMTGDGIATSPLLLSFLYEFSTPLSPTETNSGNKLVLYLQAAVPIGGALRTLNVP